ncbi:MAG: hypothetical protein R3A13_10860 [Bdellovibrionota bacterium]
MSMLDKKNKGLTLLEAAIFASIAGLIGFFAVKAGLVYKQKASMQQVADKYEAKFDGGFDKPGSYYTQVSTLMEESVATLDQAGLGNGGFSPIIYETPNGWAVSTGIFIAPPRQAGYLAEEVAAEDLEESDISVEKNGITYRMIDSTMSDSRYIVYNEVPANDLYDFSQTRSSQSMASSYLRDYPTIIGLYGYNTWGGVSWPVRATQSHFVTIADSSTTLLPPSNDCSDLTGVDLADMSATCAVAFPGSVAINSGAPNLTGLTLIDGTAEAICCACSNANALVDGCHTPPAAYIGSESVDDTDIVANAIITPTPSPTCPPNYAPTSFCDSAQEKAFYCIECHPDSPFDSYCGRCISDRQTACATCRAHCSLCDEDGPPPTEQWFYRGEFDRRCWAPELCPGVWDPPPSPTPTGKLPKPTPRRGPVTGGGTLQPTATPANCPPCAEGKDCSGRVIEVSNMECPKFDAAKCQYREANSSDYGAGCDITCGGAATHRFVSWPVCDCIPCSMTIAQYQANQLILKSVYAIGLLVGDVDGDCATLGGTLGPVFTQNSQSYRQCNCATGWGANGCSGELGSCTLVNRYTGTLECTDSADNAHYAACQNAGGYGAGVFGQGEYCMCGGLIAGGSTNCSNFTQDYSAACVETGGVYSGGSCDYSAAEASCLGNGDTWNSVVQFCETSTPAGPSQGEQECLDGTTYGAPGIWNEPNTTCYRNPNHMDCELTQGMFYSSVSDSCHTTPEEACTVGDGGTWNGTSCDPGGGGGAAQNAIHDACTGGGQCSTTIAAPPEGMCVNCAMIGNPPTGSFQFEDGNGHVNVCENMGSSVSCTNLNTAQPTDASQLPASGTYTGGPGVFVCGPPNDLPGPGGCHAL